MATKSRHQLDNKLKNYWSSRISKFGKVTPNRCLNLECPQMNAQMNAIINNPKNCEGYIDVLNIKLECLNRHLSVKW